MQKTDKIIDCKSKEGVVIGLIDSIISISRVLKPLIYKIDPEDSDVRAAAKDLISDKDVFDILSWVGNDRLLDDTKLLVYKTLIKEALGKTKK